MLNFEMFLPVVRKLFFHSCFVEVISSAVAALPHILTRHVLYYNQQDMNRVVAANV